MITAVRISRNLAAVAFAAALFTPPPAGAQGGDADPWSRLPGILAAIKAPAFPARDCPVSAKADGATDVTDAIRITLIETSARPGVVAAGDSRGRVPHRPHPPEERREPPRSRAPP